MTLEQLERLGFDKCDQAPQGKHVRVGCTQCNAAVIQGVPCHEKGCPNARRVDRARREEEEEDEYEE